MTEPADVRTGERVALVVNPSKPDADRARVLLEAAVRARGGEPVVHLTTLAEPGAAQARRALQEGCTALVAVGGDGTVREVVQALVEAPRRVPLGIVPLGTANLFARNLSLPLPRARHHGRPPARTMERCVEVALGGATRAVDVGVARFAESRQGAEVAEGEEREGDERVQEHLFLVVAGIGRDAETVMDTLPERKERIGWWAYFESGMRQLRRPGVPMTLRVGGRPAVQVQAWSVLAGNCGRLPLGAAVFPDARYDDGVLDVLTVSPTRPRHWVGVAATGLLRRPVPTPLSGLTYERAARLEVVPHEPLPVQLDGDAFGPVPQLHLSVLTRALTVRVGRRADDPRRRTEDRLGRSTSGKDRTG